MSEKELQLRMVKYLKKYFFVDTEVYSSDNSKRIDIAMVHKSDIRREYPIGIEIKINEKKRGKDLANWIKQASLYSEKLFKNYGKCLIVTCPQITFNYLNEGSIMHQHTFKDDNSYQNNICTFLGQFNIGEFQKYEYHFKKIKYRIVYKGAIIWDEKDNILRINNYERLVK